MSFSASTRSAPTTAARSRTATGWRTKPGFVWKSEQWLGPVLGRYTIEILRPYDG
ncbi:MAG TPA: hypothetical protein VMM55_01915 [Thermohalobaculum sp.]|nr:hypothetical protein [Thermohalobaculum sp.]